MKPHKNLLFTLSVISLMLLTACGLFNFAKQASEVASEIKEVQERVELGQPAQSGSKDGPQQVSGPDIDGVPLYSGSVRVNYLRQTHAGVVSTGVYYLVPASLEEAKDFYSQEMKATDWEIKSQVESGEMYLLEATDASGGKLVIVIVPDESYEDYPIMVSMGYDISED